MSDYDKRADNDLNGQVKDAEITDILGTALHDSKRERQAVLFVLVVVCWSSEDVVFFLIILSNRALFC